MGKHPQNRFRKLVIVGPTDKKQHQPGPRWWGPKRASSALLNQETQIDTRAQFKSLRMAVMPTLSRGLWLEVHGLDREFCSRLFFHPQKAGAGRGCFAFPSQCSDGARFYRPPVEEEFVSKKANGSVRWHSDREVAPLEGGRG